MTQLAYLAHRGVGLGKPTIQYLRALDFGAFVLNLHLTGNVRPLLPASITALLAWSDQQVFCRQWSSLSVLAPRQR